MSESEPKLPAVSVNEPSSLVVRSIVPRDLPYKDYREFLRRDFFYSCAYCTICESEATTIAFTIDHYEPQSGGSDDVNDYSNLMYACTTCNVYKSDLSPPFAARAAGIRHFRPDQDKRSDHFELSGVRLNSKTPIGAFSIETIELNRLKLRKLRDLRRRLTACDALVAEGVQALRHFQLDQLPSDIKGKAIAAIANASRVADRMAFEIDQLLGDYARSPNADPDPEATNAAKQRAKNMRAWQQLFPGSWRARTPKRASSRPRKSRKPK